MEASVRLRKDNPNLTDLSDSLRPTKLAEKYTELYDNDWTDAFEELHNKCRLPEEKVVQCLLKILKVLNRFYSITQKLSQNGIFVHVCDLSECFLVPFT